MKVLMLAAGRSKRMKPIEDKNFLNFLGRPLIMHQLELLKNAGFNEVIVVGGKHNLERIGALKGELEMDITVVEQEDLEMGMCGAVLAAKELISEGPVLVFSSNDVVEEKAFELVKEAFMKGEQGASYILGKKVASYFPGGYLEVDKEGYIKNIVEKPEPGSEPSDMINLVVHLHSDGGRLVAALEAAESGKDDVYEVALTAMIGDGAKMRAVSYNGFWQPIKFPWHVMPVFRYLFGRAEKGVARSAVVAKSAVIGENVIIGDDVKVMENAVVHGPAYIGKGSVVANNALVRDSQIGEECVVGFSTEVARSFLGDEVWTHSNYIGDSVIGDNVSFGGGTVTGNLRLDEKNVMVDYEGKKLDTGTSKFGTVVGNDVRVGINTSIMPGVRIGRNSLIGAGIVVGENVAENSFVRGSFELRVDENKFDVGRLSRGKFKRNL